VAAFIGFRRREAFRTGQDSGARGAMATAMIGLRQDGAARPTGPREFAQVAALPIAARPDYDRQL
jgi:hypothetical protein